MNYGPKNDEIWLNLAVIKTEASVSSRWSGVASFIAFFDTPSVIYYPPRSPKNRKIVWRNFDPVLQNVPGWGKLWQVRENLLANTSICVIIYTSIYGAILSYKSTASLLFDRYKSFNKTTDIYIYIMVLLQTIKSAYVLIFLFLFFFYFIAFFLFDFIIIYLTKICILYL